MDDSDDKTIAMDKDLPDHEAALQNGKDTNTFTCQSIPENTHLLHDISKYYPNSCCQNFGVDLKDGKKFWQERLGSALWYDDGAVDMIQIFQCKVDTSKAELQKLCNIENIPQEAVPIIMKFEDVYCDSKLGFIHRIEKVYAKRFKKQFRNTLFYSIMPASRIKNYKFLFWETLSIPCLYGDVVFILYEDDGGMYYVLGDQVDGVNPSGWFPKATSWQTLLDDVVYDGYTPKEVIEVFDKLKDDLKIRFSL